MICITSRQLMLIILAVLAVDFSDDFPRSHTVVEVVHLTTPYTSIQSSIYAHYRAWKQPEACKPVFVLEFATRANNEVQLVKAIHTEQSPLSYTSAELYKTSNARFIFEYVGDTGVTGDVHPPVSLHVSDRGVPSLQSSRSSSEDERSVSRFCGDETERPSIASLSCRMPVTAGLPPRKEPSREDSEWIRSRGPMPKPVSWFREGTQIMTSARELAMSKSLDS